MKKRTIIYIVIIFILIIGIVTFVLLNKGPKPATIITLDINPSIQISLDKDENVIDVKALNEDAKKIVNKDMNGNLDDVLSVITDKAIENGFVKEDSVEILLYSEGEMNKENIKDTVNNHFSQRDIKPNIIMVENITKEDEELAKKYNVSPSKAAYINSITKENENIKVEDIIDKSIDDVNETKETGFYCEKGYSLEGDWCYKEIKRSKVSDGLVCPEETSEYQGKCYKTASFTDKTEYGCESNETLKDDKCYRKEETSAKHDGYKCDKGTLMSCAKINGEAEKPNDGCFRCVDESKREHPTYICVKKINGVCYGGAGKPHIDGKCINGDIEYNGKCYEKRQYEYVCKNGKIVDSKDSYCPGDKAITEPVSSYSCDFDNETLVGDKCVKEVVRDASEKRVCPSGYTSIEDRNCYDLSKSFDKVKGNICESEDAKVINNECVYYDIIEAKRY